MPFFSYSIFLIDHAWTCRVNEARKHLQEIDGLSDRMKMLMNIHIERQDGLSDEAYEKQIIEAILEEMWKFNQTYSLTFENMVSFFGNLSILLLNFCF